MKKKVFSLVLSLLLLVSLAACGRTYDAVSSTEIHYSNSGTSGGLIDLPVQGPEDGSRPDEGQNLPDSGQGNLPDASQGPSNGEKENVNPDGEKGDGGNKSVDEDGWYTSKEEVALYIHLYGDLPDNYVTKKEAEDAGWSGGNVERYTGEGTAIGGSRFGNREGLLPKEQGRTYTECDIDTPGENSRGAKRIVFSNDGLVYYTEDHYESFELLYGEP